MGELPARDSCRTVAGYEFSIVKDRPRDRPIRVRTRRSHRTNSSLAVLGREIHPRPAAQLAGLVRITIPVRATSNSRLPVVLKQRAVVTAILTSKQRPTFARLSRSDYVHDRRLRVRYVAQSSAVLEMVLVRGQFERGEAGVITGLSDRIARRVLQDVLTDGLLASETPKGPVSLRFPTKTLEVLFPLLSPVL